MKSIIRKIKYPAVILGTIFLLLLVWGAVIEPRWIDELEETVAISNLPPEFDGSRIALISDLQIGMWFGNEDSVEKIVNRIIEARPAAVLIAGDFVYKPTDEEQDDEVEREEMYDFMSEVERSVALVKPLTDAGLPVYAVLGNHDYGMNQPNSRKNLKLAEAIKQKLLANNIKILENEAAALEITTGNESLQNKNNEKNQVLYIAGIGSRYANNDKPQAALSQIPENAPRIWLMHDPDSFAGIPAGAAPIALAGHTHGGQIRIPFTEDWSWMALLSDERIHGDGWIKNYGESGNRLYVNRGIGFSTFPVRINCRPELTFITLKL